MFDSKIPPIENSCDYLLTPHKSVVERYYSPKYCLNVARPGDDYCVLIHSNRVCIVTLAPSHQLIKDNKSIQKLNFQVTGSIDRLSNKVSGKLKHGAQKLIPTSPLLLVECTDGSTFTISSSVTGKLLEVNSKLLENPQLMVEQPQNLGYIAIVLPDISTCEYYKNNLPGLEEYSKMTGHEST